MTRVMTLLNQKGGCGKSTLVVNLAAVVAEALRPNHPVPSVEPTVAIVSIDPQGSALWWTKRVPNPNYQIYQWDAVDDTLTELELLNEAEGLDYIFVDTPGWFDPTPNNGSSDGLGHGRDSAALRALLKSTTDIIVPINPDPLHLDPTVRTIEKLVLPNALPFTVVVNNWSAAEGDTWLNSTRNFMQKRQFPLAETAIRRYKIHTNASLNGITAIDYTKKLSDAQRHQTDEAKKASELKAAEDFYNLAEELTGLGISLQADPNQTGLSA